MSQKRAPDRPGPGSKRSRGDPSGLDDGAQVPGGIMKIELQNFMCHTFFEVDFCSTVNFIVGRNGSGKSAILMALVIGLGGKSSATNRAPNMTEFIKQGSSWGQVTITICNANHNHDAWEYELYGAAVMVERRITKQGSKYKLKNADGKTISTKKNDLTLLLDHYNIQVNNPVSILNQEMSKKFLASTDPSSKYNFFMKSTHLEQMILDYQESRMPKDDKEELLSSESDQPDDIVIENAVTEEILNEDVEIPQQLSEQSELNGVTQRGNEIIVELPREGSDFTVRKSRQDSDNSNKSSSLGIRTLEGGRFDAYSKVSLSWQNITVNVDISSGGCCKKSESKTVEILKNLGISYFMIGLREEVMAFLTCVACCICIAWASTGLGWFVAAATGDLRIASAISAPIIMPFFLFGGLFQSDSATPVYFEPIKWVSWFRYGYHMLMVNELKDLSLDCNGVTPCPNGTVVLEQFSIDPDELWWPNIAALLIFGGTLCIFAWSCLLCRQVNEKLETIKHTISKKERTIPDVKAQVRHLRSQYDEITELRDMGRKVSQLKDELIWSKVKEIEDEQIPIQRSIDKLNSHLPKVEQEIAKAQDKFNDAEASVKTLETEMSEDMRRYQSLESDQASLRALASAKKREVFDIQRKIKTANNSIKDLNMDRQRLIKRIREIEDSNKARNVEAEKAERDQELAECRSKQGQFTEEMTATTSAMENLEHKLSDMTESLQRIREDIEQTDGQIRRHQDMLRTQQEAKKNRVSVFGRSMPDLLRRVEEADRLGRFHKKPRGPFGLHIKVKDPKWANVIELAIGSLAMNFVVNDQHDKSVLQELFRKSFQNAREHPNMIMMRFRDEFYDVNSQKPQTGHPTIYDMLDIDCHVISNALVEQARIEQSLLIESSEEARMLIVGHAPRCVFNAWTLAGDDVRERGAYSNDLSRNNNRYFRDDPSQVIEEINHKIRQLREESSIQRQNKSGLENEVKDIRSQYNTEKKKQQAIKRKLENVRNRIIELDNVEEAPLQDVSAMQEELQQYGDQIQKINEEKEELAEKEETLKQEHEEANRRHTESTERDSHITNEDPGSWCEIKKKDHIHTNFPEIIHFLNKLNRYFLFRLEELKAKMHEGQKRNTQLLEILEKYKRKKKEVNAERKRFTAELAAKKREITEAQGMAEQRCPRVDSRRSAKDLEQQIRNMELRIQQGASNTGNVDEITRRWGGSRCWVFYL
ncbi:hypothetical protein ACHWQZ_G006196 [Mnemiopsis leidyi]